MAKKYESINLTSPKARFSYVHIAQPHAQNPTETPKYQTSILIPKSDKAGIAKIKQAIDTLKKQFVSKGGVVNSKFWIPLLDGDVEKPNDEAYADCMYLNAKSKKQPKVYKKSSVKGQVEEIVDLEEEFYSGCYGMADITFFLYDETGTGIAVALNQILKLEDGEPLAGARRSVADAFGEALEEEDYM